MDQKLIKILNEQINAEMYSSYLYLAMSNDALTKGFAGVAHWLTIQAQEEMMHAMKMYDFLIERGEKVVFDQIDAPQSSWKDIMEIFEATLAHEKKISSMIRNIYKVARDVFDPETEIFLSWFISEQVEEEANVSEILQKAKLAEGTPAGLFSIDQELAKRPSLITFAQTE